MVTATKPKILDRALVLDAVRVTEAAAIAAWRMMGRGDEIAADQAAVDAMQGALNETPIDGEIVVGEGDRDEAPALFVGEKVGTGGRNSRVDIAVAPLEGVTLVAKAMPNALAVLAWAPGGTLMKAPDIYMDKIACGPGYPAGLIDLSRPPGENVRAIAEAKGVDPEQVTVCVLDRPRHADIIAAVREAGARVRLIADGDIAGVIATTDPSTGIDLYLGQGGAPAGVLACAALKCVGGQFQGRLVVRSADERSKAAKAGVTDPDRIYDLHEMVRADAIFAATGVTGGELLEGVRVHGGFIHAHSIVMNSATQTVREVRMRKPV